MPLYLKPSGVEVEVNDNSVDVAESLGWKKIGESPKEGGESEGESEEDAEAGFFSRFTE